MTLFLFAWVMMNSKRTHNREKFTIGRLHGRSAVQIKVPEQKQMYVVQSIYFDQYKL